jgi:pimeloyl-ACP methyl ester carboxylesterase
MKRAALLIGILLALIAPAPAQTTKLGIVMMHGKTGRPDFAIVQVAEQMEKAGFLVERPTMCWAGSRIYDRALLDCMADVDAAIARLRKRGATAIVVGGHSLGGLGALVYGSQHDGLAGIIALAPAPGPRYASNPVVTAGTQRARALIAAGHGDDATTFQDTNTGPRGQVTIQVRATPNIFLSFTDMSGPANLAADAAAAKAPVLWVSGTADPSQLPRAAGFDRVPANPLNRYLQIAAGHMDTPDAAASAVVAWLKELAGAP